MRGLRSAAARAALALMLAGGTAPALQAQLPPCLPPSKYAQQEWSAILTAAQYQGEAIQFCSSVFVPNAMAVILPVQVMTPTGVQILRQRMVYYNPAFLTQLDFSSGSRFAALSVLAHELGHITMGNAPTQVTMYQHPWQRELDADYYSGIVLARMGATPQDLQRAHRLLFSTWGSPSHPDSYRRIARIAEGWKRGGGAGEVETDLRRVYQQIQNELVRWYQ